MKQFSTKQLKEALKSTERRIESTDKEIVAFVKVRECLLKRRAEIESELKSRRKELHKDLHNEYIKGRRFMKRMKEY